MINFPGHVEIEDNAKEPVVNRPRSSQKNILKVNCNKILCNVKNVFLFEKLPQVEVKSGIICE